MHMVPGTALWQPATLRDSDIVFILNEGQIPDHGSGLWLGSIQMQNDRQFGPRVCVVSSYGSPTGGPVDPYLRDLHDSFTISMNMLYLRHAARFHFNMSSQLLYSMLKRPTQQQIPSFQNPPPISPRKRRMVLRESEENEVVMSLEKYLNSSDPFRSTNLPHWPYPLYLDKVICSQQ